MAQCGEEDKILKCLHLLDDIKWRAGFVRNNKWNVTGLVSCDLTGFECFVAHDCMFTLNFLFEEKEIVTTVTEVLDKFIGT